MQDDHTNPPDLMTMSPSSIKMSMRLHYQEWQECAHDLTRGQATTSYKTINHDSSVLSTFNAWATQWHNKHCNNESHDKHINEQWLMVITAQWQKVSARVEDNGNDHVFMQTEEYYCSYPIESCPISPTRSYIIYPYSFTLGVTLTPDGR